MKHIAVVDDDEIYVKAICRMLVNEQRHVTGITSGKKLLDYAGVNDLDLVLLDIRMTEMDGFETLERLRKQEKESGKFRSSLSRVKRTANWSRKVMTLGHRIISVNPLSHPF